MADNEAISQTVIIPEQLKEHVAWQHPDRNLQLLLRRDTVQELSARSLRLCKAANPSELGGLLWGRNLQKEKNSSAILLVPALVPSKTALFNTTSEGTQNLINALRRPPQEDLRLLGFFRSHLREGLCLSPQDEAFIKQNIRDPDSIFLILRPFAIGICMAGFFFWKDGVLQTDVSDLEVPFVAPEESTDSGLPRNSGHPASAGESREWRNLSTAHELSSGAPDVKAEPVREDEKAFKSFKKLSREPNPGTSRSVASPPARPGRSPWKVMLVCALIAFAGLAVYLSRSRLGMHFPSSPSPARTGVGLQVKIASNGQMDVSWNQNSPDLKNAQGASLTILDGTIHRQLYVSNDQLRFGKIAYFPNSGDVQFSLEIRLDSSRSIAESVRVLPKLGVAQQVGAAQRILPMSLARHSSAYSEAGRPPAVAHPLPASTVSTPRSGGVKSLPVQLFASLNTPVAVHSVAHAMSPPPALDVPSGGLHSGPKNIRLVADPLPSAPVWKSPPVPPPVSSPKVVAPAAYSAARPLRQVVPKATFTSLSKLYRVTNITIQVQIDKEGRVTEARVVQKDPSADALLAAEAVAAAKQWTFAPATLHGKNVPSDHTILFRFRPGE